MLAERRSKNERTKWVDGALAAWQMDYIINTRPQHATHRLQFAFWPSFRYTSFSTFRFPSLSIRRSLSFFRRGFRASSSDSLFSSTSSSRFRLTPLLPAPPFPPPTLILTRGGTANPNAFPTLERSSLFTSNIFLRE